MSPDDALRQLLREEFESREVRLSPWRPIASAPHFRQVLLWWPALEGDKPVVGMYSENFEEWECDYPFAGGDDPDAKHPEPPTHWMPFPALPSGEMPGEGTEELP